MTRLRTALESPRASSVGLGIWAALVFGFLYLPIVVVAVFSFVENRVSSLPLQGFTTRWYTQAFSDQALLDSLRNSVMVGLGAVAIAVTFGVPGALLVDRHSFPGKAIFRRFVLLPLILPGVITGVSFLTFYSAIGFKLSLTGVSLAHGTALISTVLTTCYAQLVRMDRAPEEASLDLGASRWKTFWFVIFPQLRTAILASSLLAFTLSFDEIPVTFFIIGPENTLPLFIWSSLRQGFTPEINAISTIVVLLGVVTIVLFARLTGGRAVPARPGGNP